MTVGLLNNAFCDFLLRKFGEDGLRRILEAANLPSNTAFAAACPYADSLLER